MFEQFTNSVKATLYDRVSSPLSSSFLVSWCLWNYKIIIVLFSSMQPYQKYSSIDIFISTSYFSTPYFEAVGYILSNGFVFPLISALAYIYLYPIPSRIIYEYHIKQQLKLKNAKNKIEDLEVLTIDDSIKLKKFVLGQEKGYVEMLNAKEMDIEQKRIEIESLISTIKTKEKENLELKNSVLELSEKIEAHLGDLDSLKTQLNHSIAINAEGREELNEIRNQLQTIKKDDKDLISGGGMDDNEKIRNVFKSTTDYKLFSIIVAATNEHDIDAIKRDVIYNVLRPIGLTKIAIDNSINSLRKLKFIDEYSNGEVSLTNEGKEIAVELMIA